LSYLPDTFRALPKPTALYAVADAFGNELLQAENSLVDVMRAHWVDQADKNAEFIRDLACIASLYGLAPRGVDLLALSSGTFATCPPMPADESVGEFREHLKRYIRTFLEGTVTVQGILRIVAEALALRIADDYADMDPWWTRRNDELVTYEARGEDATSWLFGFEADTASGEAAGRAQITGTVDLGSPIDLRDASVLHLNIDNASPVKVDLAAHLPDPAAATLDQVVAAIDNALGQPIASRDGSFLRLASPTEGPTSRLEVLDVDQDAAQRLLGLSPHVFRGADATAARVTGTVDLGSGVDLSQMRYLRLLIDGSHLAEIDCAGSDAAATTLDEIVTAINAAIGVNVASHDGHFLTLASPTTGFNSSISFHPPASQDAFQRLFGPVPAFHLGRDARPAEAIGTRDLSRGVDLSSRASVRIRIDNGPATTVNCAGSDPARTMLPEIVAAFDSAVGRPVASHDGRFIRLASPTSGASSSLVFELLPTNHDALEEIFGMSPRVFVGQAATSAQLVGTSDLSKGKDLGALYIIQIALDNGSSVEINTRSHASNPRSVALDEIVNAINTALGGNIATHNGQFLILTSATDGAGSRISVQPLERILRRRFVTRAFITDEATQAIFGFPRATEQGKEATRALVSGKADLSRGIDLRQTRFLRISMDDQPAVEVDFVSIPGTVPRPRAAMPGEIVAAINAGLGAEVASHSGGRLMLTSRTSGTESQIAFEAPRSADASDLLFGIEPTVARGRDGTPVTFVGTVDLSAGVDLSAASRIKIGVDAQSPVEINCAGVDPAHTSLNEIVMAINIGLQAVVARHDGTHVSLSSSLSGSESRLEFAVPSQSDATKIIFGIEAPRIYQGLNSEPARIAGTRTLNNELDLSVARFLRLAINGRPPQDVDCASTAAKPSAVPPESIIEAINQQLGSAVASFDGTRLILTSPIPGAAARIELLRYTSGDARAKLFGDVEERTNGEPSTSAILTGTVDLLTPVNLLERRLVRLSIDGSRPVDIDVSGATPDATFLDEIVAKINAVFPGLASATDDDHLRLTSPTAGESSRLEVLPLRLLEIIEYPPKIVEEPPIQVRHADSWQINNTGAVEVDLEAEIHAQQGIVGPMLVNRTEGWRIRLGVNVRAGERVRLWRDPDAGIQAAILDARAERSEIPSEHIYVESLGAPTWLTDRALRLQPGSSSWTYMDCEGARFNFAHFNRASFAGGSCRERGVFNISKFVSRAATSDLVVFSPKPPLSDPRVEVRTQWTRHQPGAFTVNLPADLPESFGGQFNRARFGGGAQAAESYDSVVTEPETDPDHWVQRLAGSKLVEAHIVPRVPIGFEAMQVPFRSPRVRKLSGGTETEAARLYLAENDVPGFIELRACEPGAWGNAIGVTARLAGPARFDVTVSFQGARFENARQVALAGRILKPGEYPLAALAEELLKPGPVGVLQAKAAGVRANVTRDRTHRINSYLSD
jgi:hypothetical protein